MSIQLRDYQRAAIDGVYEWFNQSSGNPLVVVPTGGGKSIIAACMVQEILEEMPGERIMVVTHVRELIEQNHDKLLAVWPGAPAGVYSAGLRRRDVRAQILFCGVQSIFKRAAELGHFDLVMVDEAHLIPPSSLTMKDKDGNPKLGMYQRLLSDLREINPQVKMIGLTATPFRTDTGRLDDGEGKMFDGVAYECDVATLIEDGYLCNLTNKAAVAEIDTSKVGIRAGEFKADELERAAMRGDLVKRGVAEIVARGDGRKAWVVFACGIAHAMEIADELEEVHGIECQTVFGTTPSATRTGIIQAFKAGSLRCIVNVGVLTTGFDAPHIDLIALMRPTQSPGLYVQMVGRGLRIAEGKDDCLVLDFGTNVMRHGPLNRVRARKPKQQIDEDQKICPGCRTIVMVETTICPTCGHEFVEEEEPEEEPDPDIRREPKHDDRPDTESLIVMGARDRFETWHVDKTVVSRHSKMGKPDSMRVTYICGLVREISEWVCFEHQGYARTKARQWWRKRLGELPIPETVADAMARFHLGELCEPSQITVDISGKYPELKAVKFSDPVFHEGNDAPDLPDTEETFEDIPF